MFLQACVCPQGGGVSASVHAGIPPPGADPPDQTPPGTRQTPLDQADPPGPGRHPPGSRLQQTVYERLVRILLECILVVNVLFRCTWGGPLTSTPSVPVEDFLIMHLWHENRTYLSCSVSCSSSIANRQIMSESVSVFTYTVQS